MGRRRPDQAYRVPNQIDDFVLVHWHQVSQEPVVQEGLVAQLNPSTNELEV
jgi:hypothetical protein